MAQVSNTQLNNAINMYVDMFARDSKVSNEESAKIFSIEDKLDQIRAAEADKKVLDKKLNALNSAYDLLGSEPGKVFSEAEKAAIKNALVAAGLYESLPADIKTSLSSAGASAITGFETLKQTLTTQRDSNQQGSLADQARDAAVNLNTLKEEAIRLINEYKVLYQSENDEKTGQNIEKTPTRGNGNINDRNSDVNENFDNITDYGPEDPMIAAMMAFLAFAEAAGRKVSMLSKKVKAQADGMNDLSNLQGSLAEGTVGGKLTLTADQAEKLNRLNGGNTYRAGQVLESGDLDRLNASMDQKSQVMTQISQQLQIELQAAYAAMQTAYENASKAINLEKSSTSKIVGNM